MALGLFTAYVQLASIMVNLGHYNAILVENGLCDRFFTPYLSPIVGHGLLIASTIRKLLTGHSSVLRYPGLPYKGLGPVVDLGGYDGFDLWFINIPTQMPGRLIVVACLAGVLLLLAGACVAAYAVLAQLRVEGSSGECAQASKVSG
jgi:hypothetical protein